MLRSAIVHFTGPFNGDFEMPLSVQSLAAFRRWTTSARFPRTGRIETDREFVPVAVDRDGYQRSDTLGHRFQLAGSVDASGYRRYRLMSTRL